MGVSSNSSPYAKGFDDFSQKVQPLPAPSREMRDAEAIQFYYGRAMQTLQKEYLCRQDIQNINSNYLRMQERERKAVVISPLNSATLYNELAKAIEGVLNKKELSVSDLLNLYQLQGFVDKRLLVGDAFEKALQKFKKTPEQMVALAEQLPLGSSEELFDQAIHDLFGNYERCHQEVRTILAQKRVFLQRIKEAKEDLIEKRRAEPSKYPAYFDVLLDNGAIDLYDHLVEMRKCSDPAERKHKIEELYFADLSRIVLQARNIIIRTVESSIQSSHSQSILFLLGVTGAGKSTTLSFLRGDSMKKVREDSYESAADEPEIIGHDQIESCTFLPTIESIDDFIMVDYPGFSDTNGSLIALGAEFALRYLIKAYQPKVLVVHSIMDTEGRFKNAREMEQQLDRLMGDSKNSCLLGITKYSKVKAASEIKKIEKKKKKLVAKREDILAFRGQLEQEIQQRKARIETLDQEHQELEAKYQGFINDMANVATNPERMQEFLKTNAEKGTKKEELTKEQTKLESMNQGDDSGKLEVIEAELSKLEIEEENKNKVLEEREANLLNQIGLKHKIRFSDLEDRDHRADCLSILSGLRDKVVASPKPKLDPSHFTLLEEQVGKLLMDEPTKMRYQRIKSSEEFESFNRKALEKSLAYAIFSSSHPEIGDLLHLEEIDAQIVDKFDKKIVESCIKKCLEMEVVKLNIGFLEQIKNELESGKVRGSEITKKMQECEVKVNKMVVYLVDQINVVSKENGVAKAWEEIQKLYQPAINKAQKNELEKAPPSAFQGLMPDFGAIRMFIAGRTGEAQQALERLTAYAKALDEGHGRLHRLKELETLIVRKEEISKRLEENPLSLQSSAELFGSVIERSLKIKDLYGDWDPRVQFLCDKMRPQFSDLITTHLSNVICNWFAKAWAGTKEYGKIRLQGEVASGLLIGAAIATEVTMLAPVVAPVTLLAGVGMVGVSILGIKSAIEKSDEIPLVESYLNNFGDAGLASLILCLNRGLKVNFIQIKASPMLTEVLSKFGKSHPPLISDVNQGVLFLMGEGLDLDRWFLDAIVHHLLTEAKNKGYVSQEFPQLYDCVLTKIFTDLLEEGRFGELKKRKRDTYAVFRDSKESILLKEIIEKAIARFEKGWVEQLTISIKKFVIYDLLGEKVWKSIGSDPKVDQIIRETTREFAKKMEWRFKNQSGLTTLEIEGELIAVGKTIERKFQRTLVGLSIDQLKAAKRANKKRKCQGAIAREVVREFEMRKRWPQILSRSYSGLGPLQETLPGEIFVEQFLSQLSDGSLDLEGITEEIVGEGAAEVDSGETSHACNFKYGFSDGSDARSHDFKYEGLPFWSSVFKMAKELGIHTETSLAQALLQAVILKLWQEEANRS